MHIIIWCRNNSGFTLAEVMVAILIMMVGMIGLLQAINVAMDHNLRNHLREEAVTVGEKYLNIQKGKAFDALSTSTVGHANGNSYGTRYEYSKIRGTRNPYSVDMTVIDSSTNSVAATRQLVVTVSWSYKGVTYQNRVTAPVSIIR